MRSLESFEDWGEGQNWYLAKANWGDPLFPGIIDELRIYSRALSDKEIKQNMEAAGLSVTANDQKLVEVWGNLKVLKKADHNSHSNILRESMEVISEGQFFNH